MNQRMNKLFGLKKLAKTIGEYKSEADAAYRAEFAQEKTGRIGEARTKAPDEVMRSLRSDVEDLTDLTFNQIANKFGNNGFDLAVIHSVRPRNEKEPIQRMPTRSGLGLGEDGNDDVQTTTGNLDETDVKEYLAWISFKQGYSYGLKQFPRTTRDTSTSSSNNQFSFKLVNDSDFKLNIFEDDDEKTFYKILEPGQSIDLDTRKGWLAYIDMIEEGILYDINNNRAGKTFYISKNYETVHNINVKKSKRDSSETSKNEGAKDSSEKGGSSSAQATNYTQLTDPAGTVKKEDLSNGEFFLYTIKSPIEFSYIWYDSNGNKKKENNSVTTSYSKWNATAAAINELPVQSKPAATTTTGPTTAAPAATSEPAPAAQGEVAVDNLVTNVARILSNVDAGHTYALRTAANEKRMVRLMLRAIDAMPKGGVVDSSLALAKVIVGSTRAALANSNLAKADPSAVAGMREKDIERTFAPELETIMRAVVRLYSLVKDDPTKLSRYVVVKTPAAPQKEVKTSFDPRIKKLAKLRRLKVRAQMEAAIEPSAKFGRSRVS